MVVCRSFFLFSLAASLFITPLFAADIPSSPKSPQEAVLLMVEREQKLHETSQRFLYESYERSSRTGGHMWHERTLETSQGKLHLLLEEDGQPLSEERKAAEAERLRKIAEDPSGFIKTEQARKNDEHRLSRMLSLLPKAFLFEIADMTTNLMKIRFRPNPEYDPQGYEERLMHEMSGMITIERNNLRLQALEARLAQNVSFGMGLLATVKAGSTVEVVREPVLADEWKSTQTDVAIHGRAILLKTISMQQHTVHRGFTRVASDLSIPAAVAMLIH